MNLQMRIALFFLFITTLFFSTQSAWAPDVSATEIVTKWRSAIHVSGKFGTAELLMKSNEDGVPGDVRQVFDGNNCHRVVKREFDHAEALITRDYTERRDWNGFIRHLQGREAARFRTAAFETAALIFGPPTEMKTAQAAWSDDHQFYVLRFAPAGGKPIEWYIDPKTGYPAKS